MGRLFGTDGVRGVFGRDLTTDLARSLGRAAVIVLARDGDVPPTFVIGRDTRASGPILEDALVEGIVGGGGDAIRAGVVPTPGVAFLTTELEVESGVVISASHNPPEDNGIKFFGFRGFKLSDDLEDEIEAVIAAGGDERLPAGRELPMPSEGSSVPRPRGRVGRGPARRHARGRGLRERRGLRLRARRARTPGRRGASRSTPSRTARTSTSAAARCYPEVVAEAVVAHAARRGRRARRRRRPRAVRRRRRQRDRRRPGARGVRDRDASRTARSPATRSSRP